MATETVRLPITGMTCPNCVRAVGRMLSGTAGVVKATVSLESGSATVEYDLAKVQREALADVVRRLGYEVPQ